jgi:hypothetical protein
MNFPTFLIPIVVLEALAVLTVVFGLWILFTQDFPPDESNRAAVGRRVHMNKARSGDKASVKPLPNHTTSKSHGTVRTQAPLSPTERDDSEGPATSQSENPSNEIDPSWPAPTPKSS